MTGLRQLRLYSDWLPVGDPGIESQWLARFSLFVETGPGAYLVSYTMGTVFFSRGVKRTERDVDSLPPSSAEVKETVDLYHYLLSGSLWSVLG
jgi:hypothetical protein